MKHHLKRQLRRLATERPYQVVAASAAALVAASATGALLAGPAEAPARQEAAAVAEAAPRLDDAATRGQARIAAAAPVSPPASPSATATPDPDLTGNPAAKKVTATKAATKKAATRKAVAEKPAAKKPPATKVLDYTYEAQSTYYNCGPAAVRNALSASGVEATQEGLAGPLGTTEMGTNSAEDTTRVLNQMVKGSPYRTTMFAGSPSSAQIERLSADVVRAVSNGRGVVANIAGDATDTQGGWHSFPGGHYIAVVGYQDNGRTLRIADSADPSLPAYWISAADLANWIATRGYSA
ncbi:C39 family peptidase [Micromonospora mirobrigensis]|uniref:glutathione gamma-glutamylcysteinyltransferase n=1 Tax=Micromonospora mirobrigensis TaxID=262898 RepID=A0A1C4Z800_9ACTN|nr:C39 family peptidase [Micromonospora mirobrigensis]SCF29089.1 Peptidase_C39 like family protein [Micromonospora mirobrigensis]